MSLSKRQIEEVLIQTNGKCVEAAKLLGVNYFTLARDLLRHWHEQMLYCKEHGDIY